MLAYRFLEILYWLYERVPLIDVATAYKVSNYSARVETYPRIPSVFSMRAPGTDYARCVNSTVVSVVSVVVGMTAHARWPSMISTLRPS